MEQVPSGKKHKNEYFLTLDMAKELAMVENNPSSRPNQDFVKLNKKNGAFKEWTDNVVD